MANFYSSDGVFFIFNHLVSTSAQNKVFGSLYAILTIYIDCLILSFQRSNTSKQVGYHWILL